jgi:hypothetical protein
MIILHIIIEFGDEIESENLGELPLANLEIMATQLSKIKQNRKIDLRNGDRGDLQILVLQDVVN